MSTHPRISTVVERPLYAVLEGLARRDHMSLSQKARDLLRRAVDLDEDADLFELALERSRGKGKRLTHEEFWRRTGGK